MSPARPAEARLVPYTMGHLPLLLLLKIHMRMRGFLFLFSNFKIHGYSSLGNSDKQKEKLKTSCHLQLRSM